jgi:hypothetical protein
MGYWFHSGTAAEVPTMGKDLLWAYLARLPAFAEDELIAIAPRFSTKSRTMDSA